MLEGECLTSGWQTGLRLTVSRKYSDLAGLRSHIWCEPPLRSGSPDRTPQGSRFGGLCASLRDVRRS